MVPQRLLFVAPALETGGAERHWSMLLPALLRQGFEPTVLTLAREGEFFDELRASGLDTHCAGMRSRTDIRGLKRAFSFARVMPDLVVSQSVSAQVVGHGLALRTGAPHLEIVHSPPSRLQRLRGHREALVRFCAPRIDCVVAVSQAQLPGLVELGYRRDRIRVIPNGVAQLKPVRSRDELRSTLQLRTTDFVAVLLAVVSPRKRPEFFLRSVVAANRMNKRVRGLIVGDGPELHRIADLAGQTNGVVQVLGGRSDIADVLNSADVVCLTSVSGGEAMPLALLEAMSIGRPVISTDVGGVREIVVPGVTGLVIPPDDRCQQFVSAIVELAADAKRAERLGRAGRVRYKSLFNSDVMIEKYASILSEVARTAAWRRS
jgi:glycosyltransferase involved in cell wall biosynthesis